MVLELVDQLAEELLTQGLTVCTVESCTGGLIGGAFTELSGSSGWFRGGLITYSNEAKVNLAAVPQNVLDQFGAVSEETALAMVRGGMKALQTECGIAVTGVAGPTGGSVEKPVGTVWFGLRVGKTERTELAHFSGDRAAVRTATVRRSIELLLETLKEACHGNKETAN